MFLVIQELILILEDQKQQCIQIDHGQSDNMQDFSTAEESNAFYKANIKNGQTGLSIAFDLANS